MARNYLKGHYAPVNKEKCLNANAITYRSSWELEVLKFFDRNPKILKWGSEILQVPYMSTVKGRLARYYPDFLVTCTNKHGDHVTEIVEVKPLDQCKAPVKGKNQKQSTYDEACLTFITNQEKWTAAQKYAAERGWKFRILTENSIFK